MRGFKIAVLTMAAITIPASAGVVGYTSRAVWTGDVGPASWTQECESFLADTPFRTSRVVAGHLTLQQVGSSTFRNQVDVLPVEFPADGATTNNASMFTDFGATTVLMSFDATLRAWGGDFFSVDAEGVTLILNLLGGGTLSIDVPQGSLGTGAFFGWRTTAGEAVSSITFQSRTNNALGGEGFPLDNIAAVTAAVPEPGSGLLSGAVLLLSGLYFRTHRSR